MSRSPTNHVRSLAVLLLALLATIMLVPGQTGTNATSRSVTILVNDPIYTVPRAANIPLSAAVLPLSSMPPAIVSLRVRTASGQSLASTTLAMDRRLAALQFTDEDEGELQALRRTLLSGGSLPLAGEEGTQTPAFNRLNYFLQRVDEQPVFLKVPVAAPGHGLRPGDVIHLVVQAQDRLGGRLTTEEVPVLVRVRGLPSHPEWYGGDAHGHAAEFDPARVLKSHRVSLSHLQATVASRGHQWHYMTEHANYIVTFGFARYLQRVREASSPNLPFLSGSEIHVRYDQG